MSEREGAKLIIYDDEYAEAVSAADTPLGKLRALGTNPDASEPWQNPQTLADVIAKSSKARAPKAASAARIIILHQRHHRDPEGGRPRAAPPSLAPIGGVLCARPVQGGRGDVTAGAEVSTRWASSAAPSR